MTAAAPDTSMRRRSLLVKKPIARLSGDQNGSLAPSVSGSSRAVSESRARIHSRGVPFVTATNATLWPSGEMALPPAFGENWNSVSAGGVRWKLRGRRSASGRGHVVQSGTPIANAVRNPTSEATASVQRFVSACPVPAGASSTIASA